VPRDESVRRAQARISWGSKFLRVSCSGESNEEEEKQMPTGTRAATLIPQNYLQDPYLNSITDPPSAREAYIAMKLFADNSGRLPANEAALANQLFPMLNVKPATMKKFIAKLVKARMIFHYFRGKESFIEIADNGCTETLRGGMSPKSDFPAPPDALIHEWEAATGRKWHRITKNKPEDCEESGDNVPPKWGQNGDDVPTSADSVGRSKSQSQVRGEQSKSGVEFDGAVAPPASTALPEKPNGVTFRSELKNSTELGKRFQIFTVGSFDPILGFRKYSDQAGFLEIFTMVPNGAMDMPATRESAVQVMSQVMNAANSCNPKLLVPEGWVRGLGELRRQQVHA
jgi:hypothetical protein